MPSSRRNVFVGRTWKAKVTNLEDQLVKATERSDKYRALTDGLDELLGLDEVSGQELGVKELLRLIRERLWQAGTDCLEFDNGAGLDFPPDDAGIAEDGVYL